MIHEVTERVLAYRQADLEAWKCGDKSMVPRFYPDGLMSVNQPSYGFAEVLALRHYQEADAWRGFLHYDFSPDDRYHQRRRQGRQKVREIIPPDRLKRLIALQADQRRWPGKPDLFLYREPGDFMFAEVKKQSDALREPQFRFIAQLIAILGSQVDIVYVREEHQHYEPKVYAFDLESFTGRRIG